MKIFDCTLRDGANVVGKGFDAELTVMMIEGLIQSGITDIEMGNALGLGAYEANSATAPLTDRQYLELIQPYLGAADIGMFIGYRNITAQTVGLAGEHGLRFLRVGANAGDGKAACDGIRRIKDAGLKCGYSLMKAYVLPAEELAAEAKLLADCGLDMITIMDSAGTMDPQQTGAYVRALRAKVDIPIGFHGHNNLGFSVANALAAAEAGAEYLDAGLLGMARSAGNCATELLAAVMQRAGALPEVKLYALLDFLDAKLIPAMQRYGYKAAVSPVDLIYGLAGAHSSFGKLFEEVARAQGVPLYPLIIEVSKLDRKSPDRTLMERVAAQLKGAC